MNVATITGNLTKEWEVKKSKDGKTVIATNVIADNDFQNERTNFFNIKVIGKIGESYPKYTGKGSKVTIVGKMSLTNYEKNGEQKQWFEVLVQQLDSHAPKKETAENSKAAKSEDTEEMDVNDDFPF